MRVAQVAPGGCLRLSVLGPGCPDNHLPAIASYFEG